MSKTNVVELVTPEQQREADTENGAVVPHIIAFLKRKPSPEQIALRLYAAFECLVALQAPGEIAHLAEAATYIYCQLRDVDPRKFFDQKIEDAYSLDLHIAICHMRIAWREAYRREKNTTRMHSMHAILALLESYVFEQAELDA